LLFGSKSLPLELHSSLPLICPVFVVRGSSLLEALEKAGIVSSTFRAYLPQLPLRVP